MNSPFITACKNKQKAVVKVFLNGKKIDINEKDDNGRTALFYACGNGDKEIVKMLLEAGANASLEDNKSISPIHQGALKGNKDILKMLVEKGADINSADGKGRTPLIYALMQRKTEAAFQCIELGADINIKDDEGHMPIDYAVSNGMREFVDFLSTGEKNSKDNFENSPLHQACFNNQSETVKKILSSLEAEKINMINDEGRNTIDFGSKK